ncbi:MAG: hypothetical protein ACQESL_04305 [Bacteroidota bacterium]
MFRTNAISLRMFLMYFAFLLTSSYVAAQNSGCPAAGRFGIDANLYSIETEFDWFTGNAGFGVIVENATLSTELTNLLQTESNPMYEAPQRVGIASLFEGKILIDALFARDKFGGTGHIDQTSFLQASKNGEDPAIWAPGPSNVLGKNDIIDVGGFMFRDGETINDNLWFVGLFNMAEPGGTSYMDFEFFVDPITYDEDQQQFTSGGPQIGHTAYDFEPDPDNPGQHVISKIGDFIFSVSLLADGPFVETRLWVSRDDWENIEPTNFEWAGTFDGAFNNAPYGYAGIVSKPDSDPEFCGVVNTSPIQAPPWGTKNTKSHVYGTTYQESSIAEVAINLTAYGMDHATLLGDDECFFPLNTFIVKTRSSASFTAQLKDFAGPYSWASPSFKAEVVGEDPSCSNHTAEVAAFPGQEGISYEWTTPDGNILTNGIDGESWRILVDQPGTYQVTIEYETECILSETVSVEVGMDPDDPLFDDPVLLSATTSCEGDDGTISLNVTGANGPYTFTWERDGDPYMTETGIDPGDHTLEGLEPGIYAVTIQGTGDCTTTIDDIEIKARTPLDYTALQEDATCFGFTDGKIELGTVTGNEPLSYLWSTGNTSKDLLNVGAGSYNVQITDSDGCVTEDTFTITEPDAITADIIAVDDTNPDPAIGNGSITLSDITGGTGPYSFQWTKERDGVVTPNFSTDQNLTNLRRGKYTVTITDENGCTFITSANIWEPEICDDGIDNSGNGLVDCDDPACVPDPVDEITPGDASPCVFDEVTYTVTNDPEVDYVWTVPENAEITGGQGTNEITVIWETTAGGQLCVQTQSFDCLSDPVCIEVDVDDVPAQPGNIIINNNENQ